MTTLRPVAWDTRAIACGSRRMPMLVTSTMVPPPRYRNSRASSIAVCSSTSTQLSRIGLRSRARSSLSMVSSCSHRAPLGRWRIVVRLEGPVESDEQVLVHERGPKLARVDRPPDRHHLPSHVRYVRSHGLLLSRRTHVTMKPILGDRGGESKGWEGPSRLSVAISFG